MVASPRSAGFHAGAISQGPSLPLKMAGFFTNNYYEFIYAGQFMRPGNNNSLLNHCCSITASDDRLFCVFFFLSELIFKYDLL
jgi:hypothetical protein